MNYVRHAFRMLRRNPGFTATAVLSIGFGIGSATTTFTVIEAVDFHSLPFENVDRLVWLTEVTPPDYPGCPTCDFLTAIPTFRAWVEQARSYEGLAAFSPAPLSWQHGNVVEPLDAFHATPGLFDLLGVAPVIGREFLPEDTLPSAQPVAIVSWDFWQSRFGGSRDVLGRHISTPPSSPTASLRHEFTIIGVLPDYVRLLRNADVWIPLQTRGISSRTDRLLTVVGRLASGRTPEPASVELESIRSRLTSAFPESYEGWRVRIAPLRQALGWGVRDNRFVIFAISILVVLVAMLNVSGLQLARATARRRELATCVAIGASRRHFLQQRIVEGVCIGIAGAVVGIVLAIWGVGFAALWFNVESWGVPVLINYRVLIFAFALSIGIALAAALAPAAWRDRRNIFVSLREGSSTVSTGAARFSHGLIAAQIAVAVVLLTGAALLTADFLERRYFDLGYEPHNLYSTFIADERALSADPRSFRLLTEMARDNLANTPGVVSATVEHQSAIHPRIIRPDVSLTTQTSTLTPIVKAVDTHFLSTWRMRLVAGRGFTIDDQPGQQLVAIVNRAAATAFWPGREPLGRTVFLGDTTSTGEILTVVGVVENVERADLPQRNWPALYRPLEQATFYHGAASLAIRTAPDQPQAISFAEGTIRRATGKPAKPFRSEVETLSGRLEANRLNAIVLNFFALFGLLLGTMGIYGTTAFAANQRTREMGIRIALGAQPANVVALIAHQGIRIVLAGMGLGVIGGIVLRRVLASLIGHRWGINWVAYAAAMMLILLITATAILIPAWRAGRVDPMTSIRPE